jgi:hypothetical protein
MTASLYSFKLNLPVSDIINPTWKMPFADQFFVKNYDARREWEEIINLNFLNLLASTLPIVRIMVFNKPKNWAVEDAHIDPGILYALNVIPRSTDASMQWFQPINPIPKPVSYSQSNTPYLNYSASEIRLVHQEELDCSVSIVNTSIPHRIKIGSNSRTCISFRFKNNFKTWDEVYDFYKSLGWAQQVI